MKEMNAFKFMKPSLFYYTMIQSTDQTFFLLEAASYLQWL